MKMFLEIKKITLTMNPIDCALGSVTVSEVRHHFLRV